MTIRGFKFSIDTPPIFQNDKIVVEGDEEIEFAGWAFAELPIEIRVRLDGKPLDIKVGQQRPDVAQQFEESKAALHSGFSAILPVNDGKTHVFAIDFKSHGASISRSYSIFPEPPANMDYISTAELSQLYSTLGGKRANPSYISGLRRHGALSNYRRIDFVSDICATLRGGGPESTSDVFAQFTNLEYLGSKFRLPAHDLITSVVVRDGIYEPYVSNYLFELLRPGMVFLDVGANVGLFSIPGARLVGPNGIVFAVEAVARNAKIIAVNAQLNNLSNIVIVPIGASMATGSNFWVRQSASTNNQITDVPRITNLSFDKFDLIGVAALDSLIPSDRKVDLIKIDIEGREYKAFLGCKRILADRPIIFCEFNSAAQSDVSGVDGSELLKLILSYNYRVEILRRDGPREPVSGPSSDSVIRRTMLAYKDVVEHGGTHIDLCFQPQGSRQ